MTNDYVDYLAKVSLFIKRKSKLYKTATAFESLVFKNEN